MTPPPDRGQRALDERLREFGVVITDAATILGKHGVYLPDGWPIEATEYEAMAKLERLQRIEAAAPSALENLIIEHGHGPDYSPVWPTCVRAHPAMAALRTALEEKT